MPVHDWTRVNAGTFHHFHTSWITHLAEALNGGVLPAGYYAMAEQHLGRRAIADVLTLEVENGHHELPSASGPVALAVSPPKVGRRVVASPNATYRLNRRTLTVRTADKHRIVALIEIVSPANKDRPRSVEEFVAKAHSALEHGLHLLVVDLFPPGPNDPRSMHGAIWDAFDPEGQEPPPPADRPLVLASYLADRLPEAIVESVAVGNPLPAMPLFLDSGGHVDLPLEATYQAAYRGMPAVWRGELER
jgi:Protein of unknown function (DUF4058)